MELMLKTHLVSKYSGKYLFYLFHRKHRIKHCSMLAAERVHVTNHLKIGGLSHLHRAKGLILESMKQQMKSIKEFANPFEWKGTCYGVCVYVCMCVLILFTGTYPTLAHSGNPVNIC